MKKKCHFQKLSQCILVFKCTAVKAQKSKKLTICLGSVLWEVWSQDVSQSPCRLPLSLLGNENQHKLMENFSGPSLALGQRWNWSHVIVHEVISHSVVIGMLLYKLAAFHFVLCHMIQSGSKLSCEGLLIGKKTKTCSCLMPDIEIPWLCTDRDNMNHFIWCLALFRRHVIPAWPPSVLCFSTSPGLFVTMRASGHSLKMESISNYYVFRFPIQPVSMHLCHWWLVCWVWPLSYWWLKGLCLVTCNKW